MGAIGASSATDEDQYPQSRGIITSGIHRPTGSNQIYLMNRLGEIIYAVELGYGDLDLALPVPLASMPERGVPSYAVYRVSPTAMPPRLVASVAANGTMSPLYSPPLQFEEPLALRALQDKLVSASGDCNFVDLDHPVCSSWAISVYDF